MWHTFFVKRFTEKRVSPLSSCFVVIAALGLSACTAKPAPKTSDLALPVDQLRAGPFRGQQTIDGLTFEHTKPDAKGRLGFRISGLASKTRADSADTKKKLRFYQSQGACRRYSGAWGSYGSGVMVWDRTRDAYERKYDADAGTMIVAGFCIMTDLDALASKRKEL